MAAVFDQIDDRGDIETLLRPYAPRINGALRRVLLNWIGREYDTQDGGFGPTVARAAILVRENSRLNLANLQCLDRFHAGDTGIFRIIWGRAIRLDGCIPQHFANGPLHFCAIGYGDALRLQEFTQRKTVSAERYKRNRCTLVALSSWLIDATNRTAGLPDRSRVGQTASELSVDGWEIAHTPTESPGISKSFREKTILRLFHDPES